MPVCIDQRVLPNGTGVASYTRTTRAALATTGVDLWTLTASRHRSGGAGRVANWVSATPRSVRRLTVGENVLSAPDIFRIAQIYFNVHRSVLRVRAPFVGGIVHWSYPIPLCLENWTNLYTVHDLIPLTDPELTPIDRMRHMRLLARLDAVADGFITVSAASRRVLIGALDCNPARVFDCGAAVEVSTAPPQASGRDYFLVCGSIEPRKNIVRIISAYVASKTSLPLIIAGPDGWRADAVRAAAGSHPGVRWLPYQTRDTVTALIAGARALLMPSLAEGFGLPVAEAMTLGTPVLTSDRGALAEVADAAALLVDPTDVTAIATAIIRLASDDALVERLAAAGLRRSGAFAPARFAGRLLSAYASASERSRDHAAVGGN